ncbi:hypothetical protein Ahy_A10g049516 [Arachis hypogaea]|uniref:Phosphoenolpyruvate carboxylase n=1 Tax=Arachis hypogaea TaxID=3818 RepID=A0A445B7B4_ARAHY|nr:hypothetical protein Ahy_A10g049516 [Arachis hypogaea]
MGLNETELAIAAYLYGNHLMDNYKEDIVISEFTARRDVFRSLMPGKPIVSLVLDLVADMMSIELTRESGYWFLPTTFAVDDGVRMKIAVSLVLKIHNTISYTDQDCYELSAEYERKYKTEKLEELGNMLTGLDAGDSIVIAKSFSHMLNLANLAEEVQIAYRRRIKLLKMGDFADENSAITESDIEETFKRLVTDLKKSPQEVFDALKEQTVDLVLTAHPTQSVR